MTPMFMFMKMEREEVLKIHLSECDKFCQQCSTESNF